MNPYTLDFSVHKRDILSALIEVYGSEYSSLIEKRFKSIYFVPYVNYEGINSYYRFLIACKSRELSLKMLKIIGIDVDKCQVTNFADEFNDELKNLCEKLFGGSYAFEFLFCDTPCGFRSFIEQYNDGYTEDYIISNRIEFINAVKGEHVDAVTQDNYDDFVGTEEYKRIESLATYYSGVFDALLDYMNTYAESIKEYEEYYKEELARKRNIFEKKRVELFYVLEEGLRGKIKAYVDSLETEEEKVKAILSSNVEFSSDIEYFSDEYEAKIADSSFDESSKNWIYSTRMRFFRTMGVDIDPWKDNYYEVIKRDDVKPLIVYSVFANEVTRLRKMYLEEGQKEFLLDSKEYRDAVGYFADNQVNRDAIFRIMSRTEVCVNGGYNPQVDFFPIVYYTIRFWQCGCMDYVLLHEIVHAIECVSRKNREHGCGFEPNIDSPEYSTNGHHEQKRKYERLNEVFTDFFAIETCDVLHKKGIYLLDSKLLTLTNVDSFNTSILLKDLLRRFYRKYRTLIIEARLKGDLTLLIGYIGHDNFEELNDIIDKIDVLIEKGLADKLKENKQDDSLVIQYNELKHKLKVVYRSIDETYNDRINRSNGYFFAKRIFGK